MNDELCNLSELIFYLWQSKIKGKTKLLTYTTYDYAIY